MNDNCVGELIVGVSHLQSIHSIDGIDGRHHVKFNPNFDERERNSQWAQNMRHECLHEVERNRNATFFDATLRFQSTLHYDHNGTTDEWALWISMKCMNEVALHSFHFTHSIRFDSFGIPIAHHFNWISNCFAYWNFNIFMQSNLVCLPSITLKVYDFSLRRHSFSMNFAWHSNHIDAENYFRCWSWKIKWEIKIHKLWIEPSFFKSINIKTKMSESWCRKMNRIEMSRKTPHSPTFPEQLKQCRATM